MTNFVLRDTHNGKAYVCRIEAVDGVLELTFPDHWEEGENPVLIHVFNNVLQVEVEGAESLDIADVVEKEE